MNTYLKIRRSCGVLIGIFSVIAALVLLSLKAYAAELQTVSLRASGDRAEIVLNFPQAAAEEISSLQISIRVSVNSNQARVEFVQAELPAKIVESRYHSDTDTLNIYIAGTKPLFNKSNPVLSLGYVKISGEGSAAADVQVVENSLKFVRGTELVVQDSGVSYPDAVRISYSQGEASAPPTPSVTDKPAVTDTPAVTDKPAVTDSPAVTDKPAGTDNSSVIVYPPSTDNSSGSNVPPYTDGQGDNSSLDSPGGDVSLGADTSALVSAINVAKSLDKSEYSEKSYNDLMEAVDNGNKVLSNIYATQDEVDEALLVIENAIGMLELKNTPSGGDVTSPAETGGQGSGEQNDPPGEGQNGTNASEGEEYDPEESQNQPQGADSDSDGDSDKGVEVWVIVLIVIGVLLAAALVICFVTISGRKKGKHSNKKLK